MVHSRRKWHFTKILIVLLNLFFIIGVTVNAAKDSRVMQMASEGTDILIYIKNLDEQGTFSGQVAMHEASVSDSSSVMDIHTVILLDNSLSITNANKLKIKAVLNEYLQRKPEDEQVSLAVFGEDIVYLAERETDREKLSELIEGIEYQNRDSYLTDILYDEIEKLESESQYTRFIIATDGVDSKSIGYTKEELQEKLKDKNYPVYALGCIYKDNTSELENFFAISRMTSADSFLLDEYNEYDEIVDALIQEVFCVRLTVPEECRDGSEKNILLIQNTSEGEMQFTGKSKMPFQIKEEQETSTVMQSETKEIEDNKVTETLTVTETEIIPKSEHESKPDYMTIGAVILIFAAIILLIIIQITGKKKPKKNIPTPPVIEQAKPKETNTVLIDQTKYILVLKDTKNPKKIFKYPLAGGVVIGKSANKGAQVVINYDESVSRVHCVVSESEGRFYIKDLGSSNKTFLNGNEVTKDNKKEFTSGSILKLGLLEFVIEIVDERT